jgi:hypothetical protein
MRQFDPYYDWLGIPPADQPPNHYRLLGLVALESDSRVIESAADRQMRHVRSFQAGPHAPESQRVLNELAAARNTLLGPGKAAYDASISPKPLVSTAGSGAKPAGKKKNPALEAVKIVAGGVGGILLGALVVRMLGIEMPWSEKPAKVVARPPVTVEPPAPENLPPIEPRPGPGPRMISEAQSPEVKPAEVVKPAPPAPVEPVPPAPQPEPAKPVEPMQDFSSIGGAKITVSGMKPVPIVSSPNLAKELVGGTRFDWINVPTSVNIDLGALEFKVEKSGAVYLLADWSHQGSGGGWTDERLTKEQLVAKGWEPLGPCPWDEKKEVELFRKICKEGESYRVRVNKYWPPLPLLPVNTDPVEPMPEANPFAPASLKLGPPYFAAGKSWIGIAYQVMPSRGTIGNFALEIDEFSVGKFSGKEHWHARGQAAVATAVTGTRRGNAVEWRDTRGSIKNDTILVAISSATHDAMEALLVPAELAADRKQYSGTYQADGFTISLNPDGTASKSHALDSPGLWSGSGKAIVVAWVDGWKDVLMIDGDKIKKMAYKPGESINGKPSNLADVTRLPSSAPGK